MVENSDISPKPQRRRGPGRPFQKGQSGNPGGRPKGIVACVKKLGGDDGKAYLKVLDGIARGTLIAKAHSLATGEEYEVGPSWRDRIEASKELLARGWGKPAQPITGEEGQGAIIVEIHKFMED